MQEDDSEFDSPLCTAAGSGNSDAVDQLITSGADVNLANKNGVSPLFIAAQNGHSFVVDQLLNAGADVNLANKNGVSPLFIAAQNGYSNVVEKLCLKTADVEISRKDGSTPILIAADNGHENVVEILIQAAANVNHPNSNGSTPLYIAAQNGHDKVVTRLIEAGSTINEPNKSGKTPLFISAQNGHPAVVKKLLQARADVPCLETNSPVLAAVKKGHAKVVELLHKTGGVDFEQHGGVLQLIGIAIQFGKKNVTNYLLSVVSPEQIQDDDISRWLNACCYSFHADILLLLIHRFLSTREDASIKGLLSAQFSSSSKTKVLEICEHYRESRPNQSISLPVLIKRLCNALTNAGFTTASAALQSGTAAVLEDLLRKRGVNNVYIVGSWADGWGSSVTSLNGGIAVDSDIDVTQVSSRRPIHLRNTSSQKCEGRNCDTMTVEDGHIEYETGVHKPNRRVSGSFLKPATDIVIAHPCCSYPEIEFLEEECNTNIPNSTLNLLRSTLVSTQCHVVAAAPPDFKGKRMRVSTNLLERQLMQTLSTIQGQFFIVLKYLIKTVITVKMETRGLKTYHAKNLLFRMLHNTPECGWQPENLIKLLENALNMLLMDLTEDEGTEDAEHKCMRHFFLPDANVYLQENHHSKQRIADCVENVILNLPDLLSEYERNLPLIKKGTIRFHPFVYLHDAWDRTEQLRLQQLQRTERIEYHQLDWFVQDLLLELSFECQQDQREQQLNRLLGSIKRIPHIARTTRETLKAMAYLRAGNTKEVQTVLFPENPFEVNRELLCNSTSEAPTVSEVKEFIWKRLNNTDSAWKFCFKFESRPNFTYLPQHIRAIFPSLVGSYDYIYLMNFDALMKALQLEFEETAGANRVNAAEWFKKACSRGDSDPQELFVMMHYCGDDNVSLLSNAIRRNSDLIEETGLTEPVKISETSKRKLRKKCTKETVYLAELILAKFKPETMDTNAGFSWWIILVVVVIILAILIKPSLP